MCGRLIHLKGLNSEAIHKEFGGHSYRLLTAVFFINFIKQRRHNAKVYRNERDQIDANESRRI